MQKKTICVRFREKTIEQLEKLGQQEQMTNSELIRTIVENYFKNRI